MRWFSEQQRARWAAVSYSFLLPSLLLASCATVSSSRKYVGSIFNSKEQDQGSKSFPALWEKRTVQFGAPFRELGINSPLSLLEVTPGRTDEFPLQIAATLLDSLLIEAGLQYYGALLKMSSEEEAEFRRAYSQRFAPEDHLLVWCELRTIWAENYLNPLRWIIFLEDDAGNQYEPERISEESSPVSPILLARLLPNQHGRGWMVQQKALMLSFPKRDIDGNSLLSKKLRFLKLTFQLKEDEETRAEGTWVFKG